MTIIATRSWETAIRQRSRHRTPRPHQEHHEIGLQKVNPADKAGDKPKAHSPQTMPGFQPPCPEPDSRRQPQAAGRPVKPAAPTFENRFQKPGFRPPRHGAPPIRNWVRHGAGSSRSAKARCENQGSPRPGAASATRTGGSPARRGPIFRGTFRPVTRAMAAVISRTEWPCPDPRFIVIGPRPITRWCSARTCARARSLTWI